MERVEASRAGGRWRAPAALGVLAVVAAILFLVDPARYPVYPRCAFHELTGLHCPGCGATRALHQLLHGRVAAALRLNALFILTLPILLLWCVAALRARAAGRPLPRLLPSPGWLWPILAIALAFSVARNLPTYPFTLLAP